jgi:hypothetical protein
MDKRISLLVFVLFALFFDCAGCRSVSAQQEELRKTKDLISEVFSDFYFVTSGEYDPTSPPQHGMNGIPFPKTIDLGRKYIFHRRSPTDNYELFEELQNRLRGRGAIILSADESFDRYIGGLAFRIVFRHGNYTGVIINSLDSQVVKNESLAKEWSLDDYVFVVEKSRDK